MSNGIKTESEIISIVEKVMGQNGRIEIDINDPSLSEIKDRINKANVRLALTKNGIIVTFAPTGTTIILERVNASGKVNPVTPNVIKETVPVTKTSPKSVPNPKRHQHTYVPPKWTKDMMDVMLDEASHVILLTGPTGCGKSTLARWIASQLNMDFIQVNCHPGMKREAFVGDNTVEIDIATGQNHIVFKNGPVVRAMQTGLDQDGNEIGRPAMLFIDEAAGIPTHVSLSLNRLLESDDPRRTITLEDDAGRKVRSHSGMRIILAANTNLRGFSDAASAAYTAQGNALDLSVINRIAVCFKMGYDKAVEKQILKEKLGDDKMVKQFCTIRDAVRAAVKSGKISTPFSTRNIIQIADQYRIFRDIGKAFYYCVYGFILPEEIAVYNELLQPLIGRDPLKENLIPEVDYM